MPTNPVNLPPIYSTSEVDAIVAALDKRVAALEAKAPPPPPSDTRTLLGGWKLKGGFARGALAIDFARMKAWQTGHAQTGDVYEYDLPAMGTGTDLATWPALDIARVIPQWWPSAEGYGYDLAFFRGKLWCSPRFFYDMLPPPNMQIFAEDGEAITIPAPRQAFAGFVGRGVGVDPHIGGGGDESGQGCVNGPTLVTLGGEIKIVYGRPNLPGKSLEHWNERAPRDPDYFPFTRDWYFQNPDRIPHPDPTQDDVRFSWDAGTGYWKGQIVDSWIGWVPRVVDGVLQGRFSCDRIYGGGLELPEGVCYWVRQGVGRIDYAWQSEALAQQWKTTKYVYDKNTFQLLKWGATDLGRVVGQELGPDGKVYLNVGDAWQSGMYKVESAIHVYGCSAAGRRSDMPRALPRPLLRPIVLGG